jgi:hypothetical protein
VDPIILPAGRRVAFLLLSALCAACTSMPSVSPNAGQPSPQSALDELVAADRAFSASGSTTDVVTGLSAMFAPDVAMALPGSRFSRSAAEAIEAMRANPDNAGSRIVWTPVRGGISGDGEQGFTWGYMTLTKADGSTIPLKYLSYWVKGTEGWRVAAYRRRVRPAGDVSLAPVAPSLPAALAPPSRDAARIERYRASLDATEREFSAEAQIIGLGVAFARYGRPDAVNMGGANDVTFVTGPEAIGRVVSGGTPAEPSSVSWAPDRTIVASSGDLGVTIGLIRENAPAAGAASPQIYPFFTVWQRASTADPWRYVAE